MSINKQSIFWIMEKNGKKLATLNNSNENEYRVWKPYRSKLAAAIINGIEIFPILKKSKIIYFGTLENTINHISDIVGAEGEIFVAKNNESTDFLKKTNVDVTNISFIDDIKKSTVDCVDTLYVDVLDQSCLDTVINSKAYLKDDGYIMLVIKTEDMLENNDSNELQNNVYKKIKSMFTIIQEINLTPFFKEQVMLIAKYYHS